MMLFKLLLFQHTMAWLFAASIFMVVFGVGLAFSHLYDENSQTRKKAITHRHADGLEERDAHFPLVMMLIVAGTVVWGFLYIVLNGAWGVRI